MLSSPDQSLVVPSISRDMRALYDEHFPFVWRYMAQRGVTSSAIDDLVLQVFRIVREHPSRRDPQRSRKVLSCMVARQVLREFKRHNPISESPSVSEHEGEGPTSIFTRDSMAELLDASLEGLTEVQREVFLLVEGERMTSREVADALGVAEAAVQARLDSAIKQVNAFVARARSQSVWGLHD